MSSLIKKRKVVVWLMIVVTVFHVFFASFTDVTVYAENVNTKLSNYLKLAKGKTINDIDVNALTQEELQLLGVYLSNFYIPMSTELATSRDENSAKESMVSALVEGASFDKDVAQVLVEGIWEMSLRSAKPLYVGKVIGDDESVEDIGYWSDGRNNGSNDGYKSFSYNDENYENFDSETKEVINQESNYTFGENGHATATYYTFLDWFTGLKITNDEDEAGISDKVKDLKICLFWIDNDDNKVPVFDTSLSSDTRANLGTYINPCNLSYMVVLDNLNYKNGIGSSLSNVTTEEYNELSVEDQNKVLVSDSRLYVDCFGNILVDCGVAKYVLIPACINPYCWYVDNDKGTAGDKINLVNLFMLDEAENGHIKATKNIDYGLEYKFDVYSGDDSLMKLDYWRVTRGKTETSLDEDGFIGLGNGEKMYNRLKAITTEGPDQQLRFPNFSNYLVHFEDSGSDNYITTKHPWSERVIDDFIYFDKLNTFKSSEDDDYSIFNLLNDGKGGIMNSDGKPMGMTAPSNFSANVNSNELNIVQTGGAKKYLAGIYVSYALAFYNDFSKDESGRNTYTVNYAYNKTQFPSVSNIEIDWSNIEVSSDAMDTEIKSMIYYLLHPLKGIAYLSTWFKNKISGILVGWHEDMVGSSSGTSTTGSTRYLGFTGYVTLPTLSDISWTAWLLNEYNNIVVYLIIIIFIILISYCIVGSMTFQRALIGTLLFGVLAFFPPLCINASVNTINNICDRIYGDKFTYWALVQHQSYITQLNNAIKSEDKDNYLLTLFSSDSENFDSTNYARVKLKWLSPKKINVTADVENELTSLTNNGLISSVMHGSLQQQLSGETFLDNDSALYLYRDYADIYGYMIGGYNASSWYGDTVGLDTRLSISEQDLEADTTTKMNYNSVDSSGNTNSLYSIIGSRNDETKEFSQKTAINNGFVVDTGTADISNRSYSPLLDSEVGSKLLDINRELLNGNIQSNVILNTAGNFLGQRFGIGTDDFSVTLAKINGGVEDIIDENTGQPKTIWSTTSSASSKLSYNKKDLGRYYFSLYTESPFYFFSWNILDQQNSNEFSTLIGNSSDGLRSKLLDMYTLNNQQYFYNYDSDSLNGFGEMRDYSNMRSLFYYVIPYLKECNAGLNIWSDLYGTYLYEDVKVNYENGNVVFPDFDEKNPDNTDKYTDEYIYKWWHNYNVERLFNTYSPWVDLMYSCDYAKSEDISVLGKKYKVIDPLDPTSYFEKDSTGNNITKGRLMVFSRSEMEYYGLDMKDLTVVEQKIISVQDKVYEDLLQLADYADFDNNVLVTSAGMLTTFAFNQEFSQISTFGESYNLYPQSYELKTFSYDAYLRLILSESTGEDLMNTDNNATTKSYYQRIVENSSITTGIGFIILDIIAVYAIPALKLFFLIAIFLMSILMIVASAIKLEMNIVKTVWDSLIAPLLKFSAVSIGLAWVISLFMTNGNTDVTGRGGLTISLGDPAMVVLVMIIINLVVLKLYFKICKQCFKKIVEFARAVGTSIGGAVAGTLGKVAGGLIKGKVMSDSVARGTAKARGIGNQPSAKTASGSGGNKGSRLGSFAKGALFGKAVDDIGDAVKDSKSESKKAKYDEKAKLAKNKYDNLANKDKNFDNSIKRDNSKAKQISDSFTKSADNVKRERSALRENSRNSGRLKKASNFVKDKGLSAKENYYRGASSVTNGSNAVKTTMKKGYNTSTSKIRNTGLGQKLKMDDTSRMNRAKSNVIMNIEKVKRQNNKAYRKKVRNVGKGK